MTKLRGALTAAAIMVTGLASAPEANAAILINISQVGADVVVTGSGSFDTTGLTRSTSGGAFSSGLNGDFGVIRFGTGPTIGQVSTYRISGPASFGASGPYRPATTAVGDEFGIFGAFAEVILPLNYVSGTVLAGKLTYTNSDLTSLGLATGTYSYVNARDRVTVSIGNTTPAVPEPATWAMMILGFGVVGGVLRRRKVSTAVRFA